jgi:glycosyltransferase involved in cell wall biosynthesis
LIRSIGIVVPAHDEQDRLGRCLAALWRAAHQPGVPQVRLVVVADSCTDSTVEVARRADVEVIELAARSAGAARAAGFEWVLRTCPAPLSELWLATTDADSIVPLDWLAMQMRIARAGWEAIAGTVIVSDWEAGQAHLAARFAAQYGPHRDDHPHVHGANLGISASALLRAGGFPRLALAEDHALVDALTSRGVPVARPGGPPVTTSGRLDSRAPGGFGGLLRSLCA